MVWQKTLSLFVMLLFGLSSVSAYVGREYPPLPDALDSWLGQPQSEHNYHYLGIEGYRIDKNSLKNFLSNTFVAASERVDNTVYRISHPMQIGCAKRAWPAVKCQVQFCGEYLNGENDSNSHVCDHSKVEDSLVSCSLDISLEEQSAFLSNCGRNSAGEVPESIRKDANRVPVPFEDIVSQR